MYDRNSSKYYVHMQFHKPTWCQIYDTSFSRIWLNFLLFFSRLIHNHIASCHGPTRRTGLLWQVNLFAIYPPLDTIGHSTGHLEDHRSQLGLVVACSFMLVGAPTTISSKVVGSAPYHWSFTLNIFQISPLLITTMKLTTPTAIIWQRQQPGSSHGMTSQSQRWVDCN